jgi:hypothetical protein
VPVDVDLELQGYGKELKYERGKIDTGDSKKVEVILGRYGIPLLGGGPGAVGRGGSPAGR